MKRIRFSKAEIECFTDMAAIAEANVWGEGDYQNWDTVTRKKAVDSICEKMRELSSMARACAQRGEVIP